MFKEVKCKKCRRTLLTSEQTENLLNAHNEPLTEISDICETVNVESNVFLNEEHLPDWITLRIEASEWSRGRINCPHCDSRIGAFDYVSGQKCNCSNNVLPPIHIIKSKVDLIRSTLT
ncbi:hypothetical protein JTB14_008349 [Gonioctena quinquepunctata]|nr:hypothetical protein JTB14_008349 [Gonioctena quinquepunctata]